MKYKNINMINEINEVMEERLTDDLQERYGKEDFHKEWEDDLIVFKEVMKILGKKVDINKLKLKGGKNGK